MARDIFSNCLRPNAASVDSTSVDPSRRTQSPPQPQPEELVVQAVRRHQDGVRAYLVSLGCPESKVDDVVQETFLACLASCFEDRGPDSAFRFLRKVARNLFLKSLRGHRQLRVQVDLEAVEVAWCEFDPGDDGAAYVEALRDCLERMGARSREVFRLRYEEELPRADIAGHCGMGESGVNAVLNRGRKSLRECIERRLR